ncbi:MAG: glycoside hydrolase family 31 protein [Clostridiales bacterium]|nr:glycoside hydrolase family 31 protein [Clostridiales bacterium]
MNTSLNDLFRAESSRLIYHYDCEEVWIEPWGRDSLRVRATVRSAMEDTKDWALLEAPKDGWAGIVILRDDAWITNGALTAHIEKSGRISFMRNGENVLVEFLRNRRDLTKEYCSALDIDAREFKANIASDDYQITARFESDPDEKLYGMGQYQQPYLNIKGCELELAHRNSQASVPFVVSSKGYGFLWNNPAVGSVAFGRNVTRWTALSSKQLDYWVTAGDTPDDIVSHYASVTGTVPMMPDWAMGFWQCKLRYWNQQQLLSVAREYKRRGLPLDVIVVDFFHWPHQGDWDWDYDFWPDPESMIRELDDMGVKLMVSIWPTVEPDSVNYQELLKKGYLIRTDRGMRVAMDFQSLITHFDATNPGARRFIWETAKKNYFDKGVSLFWLDEAEPEYKVYDFELYRYHEGPNAQIGNLYPRYYAQAFYEGMREAGVEDPINLLRCAWAGSQRYGALVWSGDIHSSFAALRNQFAAGLNMGLAGIPWWTTDIGGFHGGDPTDPAFRELVIRWFQYGLLCPVMRLHGDREPQTDHPGGLTGGGKCGTGADNEIWSFGEEAEGIITKLLVQRERMKPYIREVMREAHELGRPVIRTLFYEFPADPACWEIEHEFMMGGKLLAAPVMHAGADTVEVYLPKGADWIDLRTGTRYHGGTRFTAEAPITSIPVYVRADAEWTYGWIGI